MSKRLTLLAATTTLLLAACGGGGGGGSDPDPTGSYDASAAFRNILTASGTWTVSGTGSDNKSYSATISLAPGAVGTFPLTGTSSERSVQTADLVQGGTSLGASTTSIFFDSATLTLHGSSSDDGTCTRITTGPALPADASVGDSGTLYTSVDYDGCTSTSAQVGTSSTKWSLVADSGRVYFCAETTSREGSSTIASIETDCLEIDEDGTLGDKARIRLEIPGELTIDAQN